MSNYLDNFEMYLEQKTEVIQCSVCKGTGAVSHEEMTCYHKRDYDHWIDTCYKCDGHGKYMTKTTEVKVKPKTYSDNVKKVKDENFSGINESWKEQYEEIALKRWDFLKKKYKG